MSHTLTRLPLTARSTVTLTSNVSDRTYAMIVAIEAALLAGYSVEIHYPEGGAAATVQQPYPCNARTIVPNGVGMTLKGDWIVRGKRTDTGEDRCYRLDAVAALRLRTDAGVVATIGYDPATGNPFV